MYPALSIIQLILCSHVTHCEDKAKFERGLRDILDCSQACNPVRDITSALVTDGAVFAHVIEGPSAAIENLYPKIVRDTRHNRVLMLQHVLVHVRLFDLWPAAFVRVGALHYVRALDARSTPVELTQASISILKACRPILLGTLT